MKLSRLLATLTIVSALAFGGADANAKSKRHSKTHSSEKSSKSSKSKKASHQAAMPADDDASAESDKASAPAEATDKAAKATADESGNSSSSSSSTTTTTTTDDTTVTPPPGDATGTAPPETTEAPSAPSEATPMAQPAPETVPPSTTTTTTTTTNNRTIVFLPMVSSSERAEHGYSPVLGIAVSAGGGAMEFVGGAIKNATDMGGFWTVRALIGSRSIVGLEAAYVGSAQGISSLGLANDARLLGNGVEGTIRLNAPLAVKRFLVEPFGFAGAGWTHYNIVNSNTNAADIRDSDDVVILPVGGGLTFGYSGLFVDARFTYRFSYDNDLVRGPNQNSGQDNWTAGGTVGFEF